MAFDEQEQATQVSSSTTMAPWATQRVTVGSAAMPIPQAFGWLSLDLWNDGSSLFGHVAQGYVMTLMSAEGRYGVGYRAARLDSACDF
jgi:hypothetical protein